MRYIFDARYLKVRDIPFRNVNERKSSIFYHNIDDVNISRRMAYRIYHNKYIAYEVHIAHQRQFILREGTETLPYITFVIFSRQGLQVHLPRTSWIHRRGRQFVHILPFSVYRLQGKQLFLPEVPRYGT